MIDWRKCDSERIERLPDSMHVQKACEVCDKYGKLDFFDRDLDEAVCTDCTVYLAYSRTQMRLSVTHPDYGKGKKV